MTMKLSKAAALGGGLAVLLTPMVASAAPAPAPASGETLTIEQIQGEGATSPYVGATVTTTGVVTAAYPDGGFNGAYIQTEGSGGEKHGAASSGIFVYSPKIAQLPLGTLVKVTGRVMEFGGKKVEQQMTEIGGSGVVVEKIDRADVVAPVPVTLESVPAGDAEREKLEGMLVHITGPHTITDNYSTGRYGQIGLAPGAEPFYQPTERFSENDPQAQALDAANMANKITLDDGASRETSVKKVYANKATGTPEHFEAPDWPASYVDVANPARVGAHVTFNEPMILDYRFQWNLQPRQPVQEKTGDVFTNHSWDVITLSNNARPAAPKIAGDVTISSFNVLNYFTDLGVNEDGCKYYPDVDMKGLTTDYCTVRGAYSAEAFANQQAKIVEAITELDSTVVGLEEIENSAKFGHDRDAALATLTAALNKKAGAEKWAYVPSPPQSQRPAVDTEDVIRLAYIYQKDKVAPVGESKILVKNQWFDGWARQPLAQKWSPVAGGQKVGTEFVSVVNHFKSKGSVATKAGTKDPLVDGDNQTLAGNNNLLRVNQAKEMTAWVKENYPNDPVIILGDLNSYSKEAPVEAIKDAGYTSVAEKFGVTNLSYQYGGVLGSLDHALVNSKLLGLVTGADVWNVNALEPVAFEYARYHTTINPLAETFDLSAYRSSDHDPIKVGLNLVKKTDLTPLTPAETPKPEQTTPAPQETTPAPEQTTPAPQKTTPAPGETSAPEETTPAPHKTTPAPQKSEGAGNTGDQPNTGNTEGQANTGNSGSQSAPQQGEGLAFTGAGVAGLALAALAALGAGVAMVLRRRES
ncbi:putative extracellular nuclease [Arcanobacterium wilhelmae]|uniref:Extracellular nuclease n=1 Tax=Arcanobacterium wilhelmae TaxID=1803177 RepID=A0ABT9NAI6_9ACTO|nr:ExeM/NucH family extracellular endonuclease [Arcanobacterium wilhelmae]MDP9800702.1 putative extracellular nuclease [Arcanobacterium wilhelmae]WFN90101.1 ExeM/NucH family extracellular endonuclease [Arcanobacterium wilhelmae]